MNKINLNRFQPIKKLNFKGENKIERTPQQYNKELTEMTAKQLYEDAQREVPENGQYSHVPTRAFKLYDTDNIALLSIKHDEINPKDQRRLVLGVRRYGTDRVEKVFLKKGTKQEILDYIKDSSNIEEMANIAMKLSDSVNEYYS